MNFMGLNVFACDIDLKEEKFIVIFNLVLLHLRRLIQHNSAWHDNTHTIFLYLYLYYYYMQWDMEGAE